MTNTGITQVFKRELPDGNSTETHSIWTDKNNPGVYEMKSDTLSGQTIVGTFTYSEYVENRAIIKFYGERTKLVLLEWIETLDKYYESLVAAEKRKHLEDILHKGWVESGGRGGEAEFCEWVCGIYREMTS